MSASASPISPVSPDSPGRKTRDKKKQLSNHLRDLYGQHVSIQALTAWLAEHGGEKQKIEIKGALARALGTDEVTITRGVLANLNRAYKINMIGDTRDLVDKLTKRVPRVGRAGGFRAPKVFGDEIATFFVTVRLPATIVTRSTPTGQVVTAEESIISQLTFPSDKIATSSIMAGLFTVYAYHAAPLPLPYFSKENLLKIQRAAMNARDQGWTGFTQAEQQLLQGFLTVGRFENVTREDIISAIERMGGKKVVSGQKMGIDQQMRDYLPQTLQLMIDLGGKAKKCRSPPLGPRDLRNRFYPDEFRYADFQTIVSTAVVSNPALWTQEQRDKLGYDPATGKGGMPPVEKAAYEVVVLPVEDTVKKEYEQLRKDNKKALPSSVDYDALAREVLRLVQEQYTSQGQQPPAALSLPTVTQIDLDRQRRAVSIYLKQVKINAIDAAEARAKARA